jgi:hypothetical protein
MGEGDFDCGNCDFESYEPEDNSDSGSVCGVQTVGLDHAATHSCVYEASVADLGHEDDPRPHAAPCENISKGVETEHGTNAENCKTGLCEMSSSATTQHLQTLEASQSLFNPEIPCSLKRHCSSVHRPRRAISDPFEIVVSMATGRSGVSNPANHDQQPSTLPRVPDKAGSAHAFSTVASANGQDDALSEDLCGVEAIRDGTPVHDSVHSASELSD